VPGTTCAKSKVCSSGFPCCCITRTVPGRTSSRRQSGSR
jgi:hypothetical protein